MRVHQLTVSNPLAYARRLARPLFLALAFLTLGTLGIRPAQAAPDGGPVLVINEFVANHTGTDTSAFLEVYGAANTDYSTYTLLEIEGDTAGGNIDDAWTVGTTDANGFWFTGFGADMENGTLTVLLVEGFSGALNDDIDADDDGVIDNAPWTAIVDAVAVNDGGATDQTYAGFELVDGYDGNAFIPGGASRIPDGFDTNSTGDWVRNDFDGDGLPCCTATADPGEAINTPNTGNRVQLAAPLINEFVANHTGTDTSAFLEVYGAANTDYSTYTLLEIEGDTAGGNIDDAWTVGTTDANGFWFTGFGADMENGTLTVLLVEGFSGALNDDIDADDDGVIDNAPWTAIVDAVAVNDGGATDQTYAGFELVDGYDGNAFIPGGASRIPDGQDTDSPADWVRNDFDGDGLPCCTATADPGEAINTPNASNQVATGAVSVIVTEIMQNPAAVADGSGEWFELYNPGGSAVDIEGWTIADAGTDSHVIANGGPLLVPAGGYLVLGNNADTGTNGGVTVDYSYGATFTLANGDDEIILRDVLGAEIDRVEYDGGAVWPDPTGASMILGDLLADNNDGTNWCTSTSGYGDGDLGTPGATNDECPDVVFGSCGDPATLISAVQGTGDVSPLVGNAVVLEAVVVGDFQNTSNQLGGFFLQEEDLDADADPLTSEGVFVFDNGFGVDVAVGDVVRVAGTMTEFFNLTELGSVTDLVVCGAPVRGALATPASIVFPVTAVADLEAFEGMAVAMTQTLTVSDNFTTGRYGEVTLSANGRLYQGTQVAEPGAPALAVADLNRRSQIQLDDGSNVQNPLPLPPYLGPDNTLRAGDTVDGLSGVLSFGFGVYELQPTSAVTFTRVNDRSAAPPIVGGTVKVATFNVLNFFTTIDTGTPICGPSGDLDCRGADSVDEFNRQRDKIVAALIALDADVIAIMEVENNPTAAMQSLVDGLNAVRGAGTFSFVDTGYIGTDAIKVGFIYNTSTMALVGDYAILDSTVDPTFLDTKNRPALAQTFAEIASGEQFTAVANHLKSKGSDCNDVGDPDLGDGQGNCNGVRTDAATALVNWLATDPTGSGDPDFMILGDLNSYGMEDPIDVFRAAGYSAPYNDAQAGAYSYTFFAETGTLDYILTNATLNANVAGAGAWHINADEPSALDYNDYNQPLLYSPDPYRASDHDPIIVGLALAQPTDVGLTGFGAESTAGGLQVLWLLLPLLLAAGAWLAYRRRLA